MTQHLAPERTASADHPSTAGSRTRTSRTTRRAVASVAAGLAALAGVVGAPTTASAALPAVNMERVLLAAQLDPHRDGTGTTVGAADDVLLVEQALRAKGLLGASLVDGHFGSSTTTAWRQWENRVHATSTPWADNGLPGLIELRELGDGRFTVVGAVSPGSWVTEDGETIDERTRAMFRKAEQLSGTDMYITQGRGSASESAGTHVGGGVIDIRVIDRPAMTDERVRALRQVGFAAWFRDYSSGPHIHAVAINDPYIAYGSHYSLCQVYQYRFGGAGDSCSDSLAGADRDLNTWEDWQRTH
ncbi:peptidoglycan-binding protein [Terrabacter sp. MAHUQ-38]|uniref:peptidoglycan-binding protein n=1 Tax=unclassified Terrabacter TaxID=2630222 RepID=UPI00165D95C1|nr:peptidoglycan-binding protein [Terrabacter sp. MAHUQ-38]MBC9820259.1 peptidoglycan-binding protein [Terrabacter sp. MAHUQ-38]